MSARYIVRFDDLCPTLNWRVWARVEALLDCYGVRPIVAVVPDNHDPKLQVDVSRPDFWSEVRRWQAAGWTIALHGHQHLYVTTDAGLLALNPYSEFAGLPEAQQRDKLQTALAIFSREGVRADAWVAPAHSFDATTVRLLLELGVGVISDGFYRRALRHLGAAWVPQQLWRFRPMPPGLWTVCLHVNNYDDADLDRLGAAFTAYAKRIVPMPSARSLAAAPSLDTRDRLFAAGWGTLLHLKRSVNLD